MKLYSNILNDYTVNEFNICTIKIMNKKKKLQAQNK